MKAEMGVADSNPAQCTVGRALLITEKLVEAYSGKHVSFQCLYATADCSAFLKKALCFQLQNDYHRAVTSENCLVCVLV